MSAASLIVAIVLLSLGAGLGILSFHSWTQRRKRLAWGAFVATALCNLIMLLVVHGRINDLPWLLLVAALFTGWSAGIATLKLFERPSP